MDIQMEKMMMMQNPNFEGSPRILEINIEHELIKSMNKEDKIFIDSVFKRLSKIHYSELKLKFEKEFHYHTRLKCSIYSLEFNEI